MEEFSQSSSIESGCSLDRPGWQGGVDLGGLGGGGRDVSDPHHGLVLRVPVDDRICKTEDCSKIGFPDWLV